MILESVGFIPQHLCSLDLISERSEGRARLFIIDLDLGDEIEHLYLYVYLLTISRINNLLEIDLLKVFETE